VATDALTQWGHETGYAMSLYFAGPNPEAGGNIQSGSIHVGETDIGTTFDIAYPTHRDDIVEPFVRFAKEQLFRMSSLLSLRIIVLITSSSRGSFASKPSTRGAFYPTAYPLCVTHYGSAIAWWIRVSMSY
jgi:hypothetical protein